MKFIKLLVAMFAVALVTGCATSGMRDLPLSNASLGAGGSAENAVIQSVRAVRVVQQSRGGSTYVGTAVGTAAGAAIGSKVGKGNGRKLAVLLGGVVGGSMGHSVANAPDYVAALEIEVLLEANRKVLVVTQAMSGEQFMPGQRVRLINYGGKFRVVS